MKIATWNLMRPTARTISRNKIVHEKLIKCNADILILTETNAEIHPGAEYLWKATTELPAAIKISDMDLKYSEGENRVTIFSKYPFGKSFETFDNYTSVCSEVFTPYGTLIAYATIIGILGGKGKEFTADFDRQKADIVELSGHKNFCLIGDLNISFSGFAYPGRKVINEANKFFEQNALTILTRNIADSPDHIIISKAFMNDKEVEICHLPFDKKVTDHSLISTVINKK